MIRLAIALALLVPTVAFGKNELKQKLIEIQTPIAIAALEEDFPDIDWGKAPAPQCASDEDQENYDDLNDESGTFIFGTFAYFDFTISINCRGYMPSTILESTIYHEMIHWMQHVITYGEELTEPVDDFHGLGIGIATYQRLGCQGAIEGEAWGAEIARYEALHVSSMNGNEHWESTLKLMQNCVGEYADHGSPFIPL